jgi:ssDNA-binding Zn-finger/Zn-ribbon topoisomerase 1
MLDAFFIPFQRECKVAETSTGEDYGILCKCGKKTILKHGKFGFYLKCINYPECKETVSIDMVEGKPVIKPKYRNPLVETVDCPICKKHGMFLNNAGKFGPFYYCQDYPECRGIRKVPYGKKCVKCSCEMFVTVFNGERKLACMGYFEPHKCKNVEDLPPGDNTGGWANPNPLIKKYKKKFKEQKSSVKRVIAHKKKADK